MAKCSKGVLKEARARRSRIDDKPRPAKMESVFSELPITSSLLKKGKEVKKLLRLPRLYGNCGPISRSQACVVAKWAFQGWRAGRQWKLPAPDSRSRSYVDSIQVSIVHFVATNFAPFSLCFEFNPLSAAHLVHGELWVTTSSLVYLSLPLTSVFLSPSNVRLRYSGSLSLLLCLQVFGLFVLGIHNNTNQSSDNRPVLRFLRCLMAKNIPICIFGVFRLMHYAFLAAVGSCFNQLCSQIY